MSAVRRVLQASGLAVLAVALQLAVALAFGSGVGTAANRSMGRHSIVVDDHLPAAITELSDAHPGLAAGFGRALNGSSVFALALWTLLAGFVILRLRAPAPAARLVPAALRALPGVVATSLWHLLPRAVLLVAAAAASAELMGAGAWGLAGLAVTLMIVFYCTCALDLARCNVVLHGARRFHFATAARGYTEALRRPAVLAPSMLLSLGQWACVAGMVAMAIDGLGDGHTIWWVRALSALSVIFGLTRVAVAVQAGPYRR